MRNGSRNKIKIVIVAVLAFLMAGFSLPWVFTPKLRNADKPFIDLSGSVGDAIGNAKSAYIVANPTPTHSPRPTSTPTLRPTSTPTPTSTPKPTATPTPTPTPKDVEIVVANETVAAEGFKSTDAEEFILEFDTDVINEIRAKGVSVILIDDYAESRTYKKLLRMLERTGLDYRQERRQ